MLVVDHIEPIATGGADSIDNLVTACETCNQGKAARKLTTRIVRPDADLLYLETQQEIAELRRFQQSVAARDEELAKSIQIIQEAWHQASALDWHPADYLVRQLLTRYSTDVVYRAVVDVAVKVEGGYVKDFVPYLWGVARGLAEDDQGSGE